MIYP
jgi:superfamily II DNA/RNA helicase